MAWRKINLTANTNLDKAYIADLFLAEWRHRLGPKKWTLLTTQFGHAVYLSPESVPHCVCILEKYRSVESAPPEPNEVDKCYGDCSGYDAHSGGIS